MLPNDIFLFINMNRIKSGRIKKKKEMKSDSGKNVFKTLQI